VISINPNSSDAWSNKGYALTKQGKINDAVKAFDTALRLDPTNQDAEFGKIMAIRTVWPSYQGD
jgi:cytochrome c-type biogenesis protein CcmH/NrfG